MIRNLALIVLSLVTIFRLVGYVTEPSLTPADIHRIVGNPSRVSGSHHASRNRTIVTWNIERGVNFDRIAATLRAIDADVVLLQEVDRFCRRSGRRDVARDLADALDMNWTAAGEFQEVGEGKGGAAALTGQAILSRFPIVDSEAMVFSDQVALRWRLNPAQPRRGGRISLKARTAGALFYDLHVESGGDDPLRQRQIDEVVAHAHRQPDSRIVIAGDFNNSADATAPMIASLASSGFVDALGDGGDRRTQIRHQHPIDWILAKGFGPSSGSVLPVVDVSDHFPLVATFRAAD